PGVRPKIALVGGVALNVEYATTQPSWVLERHGGTCLNVFVVTLPPRRIADTSRRLIALPSICCWISRVRCPAPCEWPIRTKPRPWLYFARSSFQAASTSP